MSYRDFTVIDTADPARVRGAALLDFAAAFVVGMIAFPFPFVRAVLPTLFFVGSILLTIVVAHIIYCALTLRILGRTPGMFLLDLGPERGRPSWGRALLWGLGESVAFWPTALGVTRVYDPETGTPARMSGIEIGSTKP